MLETMQDVIQPYLGDGAYTITADTKLGTDLGLNSFELVQMVCDVEDRFGIEIPDHVIPTFQTVQDVIDFVAS